MYINNYRFMLLEVNIGRKKRNHLLNESILQITEYNCIWYLEIILLILFSGNVREEPNRLRKSLKSHRIFCSDDVINIIFINTFLNET